VRGCGQQKGFSESYRGQIRKVNLLEKVRIEIAVNDDFVEATIEAIIKSAQSGHIGDGKIFVMPMERCIRIRTRETGSEAIG
jgi:nitrogen regulatory protein P-II 1